MQMNFSVVFPHSFIFLHPFLLVSGSSPFFCLLFLYLEMLVAKLGMMVLQKEKALQQLQKCVVFYSLDLW